MRILICTQAVDKNDPILGFFHRWIEEFATHCESVMVICLREGEHSLPQNVHVFSLGKEKGAGRVSRAVRFLKLIVAHRKEYDAVFVHMNPEYVILGGALWRLLNKPIGLWYVHRSINLRLRLAVLFLTRVFSVSKESFRLPTHKLIIVGMGLDPAFSSVQCDRGDTALRIITTGRISKTKRLREMLDALDILHANGVSFIFTIAGAPVMPSDRAYEKELRADIERRSYRGLVRFVGAIPHRDIPALLARHSTFLNLSTTGSVDKAVLEAMAVGLVPVTSNEAFGALLEPLGLYVPSAAPEPLARALARSSMVDISALQETTRRTHSLTTLVPIIVDTLSKR